MGQFQTDLQLYKSLSPAARPIDTYAPIRIPSAAPQLNELAEGLSVFNRGLRKFAVEERAEFQEEEREAGEAFVGGLTEEQKREIARDGLRQAEKKGLIPEGTSPTRLIAIQEAIGLSLARDYEARAFTLLEQLSDPTNVQDIEAAFEDEWSGQNADGSPKTNLGNSFYITQAANRARADIDDRLIRQATLRRAQNTVALNKEQWADEFSSDLDLLDTQKGKYTPEFFETRMNKGKKEFNVSFFQEAYERVVVEARSLAQDGDKDRAMQLIQAFKLANPSGQKNADMGRKFGPELKVLEEQVESDNEAFEAGERQRETDEYNQEVLADTKAKAERKEIVDRLWFETDFSGLTKDEARNLVVKTFDEAGITDTLKFDYFSPGGDFDKDFASSQDRPSQRAQEALLELATSEEELRTLFTEQDTPAPVRQVALRNLEKRMAQRRIFAEQSAGEAQRKWDRLITTALGEMSGQRRVELEDSLGRQFKDELRDVIEKVQRDNPAMPFDELQSTIDSQMKQWIVDTSDTLFDTSDPTSAASQREAFDFFIPPLPAAPTGEAFVEDGVFAGQFTSRFGDYFSATTATARQNASGAVQEVVKDVLEEANKNIIRTREGEVRRVTGTGGTQKIEGKAIDQQGTDARRYRSAVLFIGVSIDDLERGAFSNSVEITDTLRRPDITPYFKSQAEHEEAFRAYDAASDDEKRNTVVGRLIANLGASSTGTPRQFGVMQLDLLKRRGIK